LVTPPLAHFIVTKMKLGARSRPKYCDMNGPPPAACRLCDAPIAGAFELVVLRQHSVKYFKCLGCGSLQTEAQHWLAEAYSTTDPDVDVGLVDRNWQMAQTVSLLLWLSGADAGTRCLDWGGGSGLFCRMMRDQGFNFVVVDKYADPV